MIWIRYYYTNVIQLYLLYGLTIQICVKFKYKKINITSALDGNYVIYKLQIQKPNHFMIKASNVNIVKYIHGEWPSIDLCVYPFFICSFSDK